MTSIVVFVMVLVFLVIFRDRKEGKSMLLMIAELVGKLLVHMACLLVAIARAAEKGVLIFSSEIVKEYRYETGRKIGVVRDINEIRRAS